MDLFEAIDKRQSVRNYLDRPVEEEKLHQILEAARSAPSAKNRQAWKMIVIRDPDLRHEIAVAARNQKFVGQAPVIIACCGLDPEYRMTCGQPADPIDAAIAIDHMTLAAAALDLGTCWIGAFYQDQVRALLHVPDPYQVIELMVLGYPAKRTAKPSRKPIKDLVSYERW